MYVSSVITGTIAEFGLDVTWIRDVYPTTPVALPTPPTGLVDETPFGMALAADGTLFVADLGIVGAGPEAGQGSVLLPAGDERFDDGRAARSHGRVVGVVVRGAGPKHRRPAGDQRGGHLLHRRRPAGPRPRRQAGAPVSRPSW